MITRFYQLLVTVNHFFHVLTKIRMFSPPEDTFPYIGQLLTEQEIINSYLAGERAATDLVTSWVQQVIRAKVWEPDISKDDIISDTTYKLLVNFRDNRFAFDSSLKTYVQRITMFTIIDAVRVQRRARRYLTERNLDPGHSEDPAFLVENKEDLLLFHRIFLHLDRKCRELWVLILHDRLTYKEISEQLSIAEGTVKTRVFRCKEKANEIRRTLA